MACCSVKEQGKLYELLLLLLLLLLYLVAGKAFGKGKVVPVLN
jgi:hypothetical protein